MCTYYLTNYPIVEKLNLQNCFKKHNHSFTLLTRGKISDWSKMRAFADDKVNAIEKLKFVLERVKNIVGKGENAGNQHFLHFPQCFQQLSVSGVVL